MQVIYSKTLKTFALLNLFVLFLAVKKRTKKTPGCIIDSFHYFFRSLIFARLRCAKIYAQRKKVEPEIKNAWPDLLYYPSVATNKRGADTGECFFQGSQVKWLTVKKKAKSASNRLFLIFFATFFNQVKKVEDYKSNKLSI